MQHIRDVMAQRKEEDSAKPVGPKPFRYAAENEEQSAYTARRLRELAGKPLIMEGRLICRCAVCLDRHWLRADVPFGHRLFGKLRMCPCNSQYAQFGDRWYTVRELHG